MKEGSLVSVKFDELTLDDCDGWNIPTYLYRKYIGEYAKCSQDGCSCQVFFMLSVRPEFYQNKFGLVINSLTFQPAPKFSKQLESCYSLVLFGDFKDLIPNSRLEERPA